MGIALHRTTLPTPTVCVNAKEPTARNILCKTLPARAIS
jgi:hypothetical protein